MAQKTVSTVELSAEVSRLLLAGHSLADVTEYLGQEHPKLSTAEVADLANDWFAAAAAIPKETRLGWCLEAHRELYRRMVEIADFAGATRAVIEIAKLSKEVVQPAQTQANKRTKQTDKNEVPWIQLDDWTELSSTSKSSRN